MQISLKTCLSYLRARHALEVGQTPWQLLLGLQKMT